MCAECAIRMENVAVCLAGIEALSDVTLAIDRGQTVGVIGPNGAGKTTLLSLVNALRRPSRGRLSVLSQTPSRLSPGGLAALRRRIAYVPQIAHLPSAAPLCVREVVDIARAGHAGLLRRLSAEDRRIVSDALVRMGCADLARRPYDQLSGGQQRKVQLARALAQEPDILLLDEPAANLDPYWQEELVALIDDLSQTRQLTILLVTHDVFELPPLVRQGGAPGPGTCARVRSPRKRADRRHPQRRVSPAGARHARTRAFHRRAFTGQGGCAMLIFERLDIFSNIIIAAVVGGAACSLVGFFLSHLRLPFMGVCLSHAALAGAVLAKLTGLPMIPTAFVVAVLASFMVGVVADRARIDANLSMSILFSLLMGLAFLGLHFVRGDRSDQMSLIWGSILFVMGRDLVWMTVAAGVAIAFAALFNKELKALLFSRSVALSAGIRATAVYYGLLTVSGLVVTANLETVGGLMLFSLLVSPPAAAAKLTHSYARSLVLSAVLGSVAALGGLILSYHWNAPTGASIVVTSTAIFIVASLIQRIRQ